jgi:hypothetical protein
MVYRDGKVLTRNSHFAEAAARGARIGRLGDGTRASSRFGGIRLIFRIASVNVRMPASRA